MLNLRERARRMAVRLAEEWFATCAGCEISILDIGEPLLDILKQVEIVHMPVLMDHKLFGQAGERTEMEIPEADVGLISGSIRNEEHRHVAEEMRRKCKVLISLGSCACHGGIPALANLGTSDDILNMAYRDAITTDRNGIPREGIPPLTDRVYALDEIVPVDMMLPGCPTTPEMLAGALTALLAGKEYKLAAKSVCDDCPLQREKKVLSTVKRRLEGPKFTPGHPLSEMQCLMEQGYLCLGPVTRGGCGGSERVPRCIRAYMTCEGCFGPLSTKVNPMVDMVGALATVGIEAEQIPDRNATLNRFSGAGRLRPVGKR